MILGLVAQLGGRVKVAAPRSGCALQISSLSSFAENTLERSSSAWSKTWSKSMTSASVFWQGMTEMATFDQETLGAEGVLPSG